MGLDAGFSGSPDSFERYALLVRKGGNLELMVSLYKSDCDDNIKKGWAGLNIGYIEFESKKSPSELVEEFSIHLGGEKVKNEKQLVKTFALIKYPLSLEQTMPYAFVDYFSPSKYADDDYLEDIQ